MNDLKIQCPKCKWEPDGGEHWMCSCGHSWNTFDTQGICPKCSKRWSDTQCPGPGFPGGCGAWSAHIDWYIIPIDFEELLAEKVLVEKRKNE